jgi:succinyl-CoA synthetase beta subunit
MRLLEHQSKALLSKYGLPFTTGHVCTTPDEAEQAARVLGNSALVLKAQVPFGGRSKGGAVVFVEGFSEVRAAAERLFAMNLRGRAVTAVSVEARAAVAREFYVGITWDSGRKLPVAILSVQPVGWTWSNPTTAVSRVARLIRLSAFALSRAAKWRSSLAFRGKQ